MTRLKDYLFKPKWASADASIRRRAVADGEEPELLAELPSLARTDPDAGVRLAALRRLDDIYHLMRIAEGDQDPEVCEQAQRRWLGLLSGSIASGHAASERLQLARKLERPEQLQFILTHADSADLRLAVLPRVNQQGLLGDLALSDPDPTVREAAARRITQPSTLRRVAEGLRKTDKQLYHQLRDRLDALELESSPDAIDRQAEQLCQRLEALSRRALPPTEAQVELADISDRWRRLQAPKQWRKRFDGALQILNAAAAETPLAVDPDAAESATEPTPGNRQLQQLIERAHRAADKRVVDGKSLQRLRDDWQLQWQALTTPTKVELQQHDQFEGWMGKLTQRLQQQAEQRQQALGQVDPLLDAVETALEGGDLAKAVTAVNKFNQCHRLIGRHRHTDSAKFKSRVSAARNKLYELRDWQHWANNKIRQRLCDEAEALAGSGLHPDAVGEKVKSLQAQWKQLDASEHLPGDKPNRTPAAGLNRRFRGLCNKAYAPAKEFFAKRAQVRTKHLDEFRDLRDQLNTAAAQAKPDLAASGKLLGQAHRALRQLDAVPPKQRGRIARQLRDAIGGLDKQLDEQYQVVERRKQKLIDEVVALCDDPDLKRAIEQTKSAQQRWQQAGRTRRSRDQKLWRQFRAAADAVFDRLGDERRQQQAARAADRERFVTVIKQVEVLLGGAPGELAAAVAQLPRLRDEWRQAGAGEAKLERRFKDRCRELESKAKAQARQTANEQRYRLRELHALIRQYECRWLDDADFDCTELTAAWTTLASDAEPPASLQRRFDRLSQSAAATPDLSADCQANLEQLQSLCIQLEFLAGRETPAPFKQQRMDYQVQRLAARMGGQQSDPPAVEVRKLEQQWLACGPLPIADSDAVDARFRAALAEFERLSQ